jgi:amidase
MISLSYLYVSGTAFALPTIIFFLLELWEEHNRMSSRFCGPTGSRARLRLATLATVLGFCAIVSSPSPSAAQSKFHLLDATIADVQSAIRSRQVTCVQVVQAYLARIKAYNGVCVSQPNGQLGVVSLVPDAGQVNALMTLNLRPATRIALGFDAHHSRSQTDLVDDDPSMPDALETAAAEDASYRKTGRMGALFCVPMGIKDEYDTFDMRTTSGADAPYANDRPPEDSVFVTRLRNAGAIILAKTNMGEYASGTDRSSWGGVMCNAYDSLRSAGHSSTGVGLSVTTNMVMCGIGEESGGSIIHPANWSEDVGLAPTQELVPRTGMIQASLYNDRVGPICRTVADTARILDVIAGYDPTDELTAFSLGMRPQDSGSIPAKTYASYTTTTPNLPLKGIKIGVMREWDVAWTVADAQSVSLFEGVIATFKKLGATIEDPGTLNNLFDDIPQYFPALEPVPAATAGIDTSIPGLLNLWFDTSIFPSGVDAPSFRSLPSAGSSSGALTYVLGRYLRNRGDANIQTISDLATKSNFWVDPAFGSSQLGSLTSAATATVLNSVNTVQRRFTIKQLVMQKLAKDGISVFIAPTTTIPPYVLNLPTEPTAHGRPDNGFSTLGANGIPELTVPAGFTTVAYDRDANKNVVGPVSTTLPFGVLLQGAPFSEPMLLKVGAAFEAATHARQPPPLFPPLPGEP